MRHINDPFNTVRRNKAILVSIQEVGLIEPMMVYPQKDASSKYLLLDGHLRLCALKELGHASADCIIATDDECSTCNARVSQVSPIQELRMIHKAVEKEVKPERVAAALNIPVRVVNAYMNLLVGITRKWRTCSRTKILRHHPAAAAPCQWGAPAQDCGAYCGRCKLYEHLC